MITVFKKKKITTTSDRVSMSKYNTKHEQSAFFFEFNVSITFENAKITVEDEAYNLLIDLEILL